MNMERIPKDKDEILREQTIEAVGEGTAMPTYEGMYDPEIAEAFKERLEEMSPEEFAVFTAEFQELTDEALREIRSGDTQNFDTTINSVTFNKVIKHIHTSLALGAAGLTGAALLGGAPVLGTTVVALFAVLQAYGALGAERRQQLGEAKVAHAEQNIQSLLDAIEEASNAK